MKLQFKHQEFQADAARAVVDVFAGQPRRPYIFTGEPGASGQGNGEIAPVLTDRMILENIRKIQRAHGIEPSRQIEGPGYNLTVEMETGVGKTARPIPISRPCMS